MSKIWAKNYELNVLMEEFTVGNDYLLDQKLIPSDCVASLAHATMLEKIGILCKNDLINLQQGIKEIIKLHKEGNFPILRQDEDGHTAIENFLIEKIGDAGKKIHTGRSRNDQVVTALRVFIRTYINKVSFTLSSLIEKLLKSAEQYKNTPMPGRTHMQSAMPSSVGLWMGAFAEEFLDQLTLLNSVYDVVDQNPLGSAASYGVPLDLDRELTAELMGFSKVQNNVLTVQNSRGRTESYLVDILDQIGISLSKMAQDLILFSLPEFGYFSLPDDLCTGSSIMPQKKNPDGLELMRARSASLSSYASQIKNILRSLPTGYNRDFQETKEPLLKSCNSAMLMIQIMDLTIEKLTVNIEKLEEGFTSDIYATDYALELVISGESFRDAYRKVGLNLDKLSERKASESIKSRTYPGTTGNLNLEPTVKKLQDIEAQIENRSGIISEALNKLIDLNEADLFV